MTGLHPQDPTTIGGYQVLDRLGEGGMGTVFLAEKAGHRAAVKVIHPHLLRDVEYRRRFAREIRAAQAVASHYVVQIIDADPDDPATPWIATRYIPGPNLFHHIRDHGPMPVTQAVSTLAGIADALTAIHTAGIVHRDLKPGNVILAGDGPHVIDFGIVRPEDTTTLTAAGSLGTPAYMSPEQATGTSDVTPASDVFSLGSIAYLLLTGRPLYTGPTAMAVCYQVATTTPDLTAITRPDLHNLLAACLARDPAHRPTPTKIITTCTHLTTTWKTPPPAPGPAPVPEPPPSPSVTPLEPTSDDHPTRHRPDPPQRPEDRQTVQRTHQDPETLPQEPRLPEARHDPKPTPRTPSRRTLLTEGITTAALAGLGLWNLTHHTSSPSDASTQASPHVTQASAGPTLTGHTGGVLSVAWSPDGRTLATGSGDMTVRLWDPATGTTTRTLTGHTDWVWPVAWSPDGRTLATGSYDNTVRLWDPATGTCTRTLTGHTGYVRSAAWSPDGRTLATGSFDKTVRLWDPATGKTTRTIATGHTEWVQSVAWSPDGRTLATASCDPVRLWDPSTGTCTRTLTGHTDAGYSVAWSPDGRTLATGSSSGTVRLWDPTTGTTTRTLTSHTDYVQSVAWSPDGRTLATASDDTMVRLWDPATGTTTRTLTDHTNYVRSVAWSPDGRTLATASDDMTVRLWAVV